ncbi:hypothetical protein [Rhodococcus sovatensis]|uniref:Uncharacterized protein n=1 Tax=Rhodococcus sovatensis TaxID=1805840 RepID=A0ABZ2PKZ2_9NOCA
MAALDVGGPSVIRLLRKRELLDNGLGTRSNRLWHSGAAAAGNAGTKDANFAALVRESESYGLSAAEGHDAIDHQLSAFADNWDDATEHSRLRNADKWSHRNRRVRPRSAFFVYENT